VTGVQTCALPIWWLSDRVGPKGRVVATDLSTNLLEGTGRENLEVRRHDIVRDPIEEGQYDLVHSRLVLEHLPEREDALRKMAAALAPGGWIVIEDFEISWTGGPHGPGAPLLPLLVRSIVMVLRRHGHDARFARRVPALLGRLGLVDVGAEGRSPVLVGGGRNIEFVLPSLRRFGDVFLGEDAAASRPGRLVDVALQRLPVLRRVAGERLDRLEALLADPRFVYVCPPVVTAWGRRPPA
jgi:SAM-dependent methyltransferase